MGQYHYVCNLDKKQYLHPHRFGSGLKLKEFGCDGNSVMTALAVLLAPQSANGGRGGGDIREDAEGIVGSWGGDRIVIAGDYAEATDHAGWDHERDQSLYNTANGNWFNPETEEWVETDFGWREISELIIPLLEADGFFVRS